MEIQNIKNTKQIRGPSPKRRKKKMWTHHYVIKKMWFNQNRDQKSKLKYERVNQR